MFFPLVNSKGMGYTLSIHASNVWPRSFCSAIFLLSTSISNSGFHRPYCCRSKPTPSACPIYCNCIREPSPFEASRQVFGPPVFVLTLSSGVHPPNSSSDNHLSVIRPRSTSCFFRMLSSMETTPSFHHSLCERA